MPTTTVEVSIADSDVAEIMKGIYKVIGPFDDATAIIGILATAIAVSDPSIKRTTLYEIANKVAKNMSQTIMSTNVRLKEN
jgi:hypothetical protein